MKGVLLLACAVLPAAQALFSWPWRLTPAAAGSSPRAALDRWLTNPETTIPGQRMGVSVPEAADRADIIEYLRTAK